MEISADADISAYDFIVFACPNIRKEPGEKTKLFLEKAPEVKCYSVVITAAMPVWRWFSGNARFRYFEDKLGRKPVSVLEIPGGHTKYKACADRPNDDDLLTVYLFAAKTMERLCKL